MSLSFTDDSNMALSVMESQYTGNFSDRVDLFDVWNLVSFSSYYSRANQSTLFRMFVNQTEAKSSSLKRSFAFLD
jgi:hypothetical protein